MENSKRYSLSFDEIENNIEIDIEGLIFKIRGMKDLNYYRTIKDEEVEEEIKYILGEDSIDKINKLRNEKGKENLDIGTSLNLLLKIIGFYRQGASLNSTSTAIKVINETNNEMENIKNKFMNRAQRRNYNRGYRKNYRRH